MPFKGAPLTPDDVAEVRDAVAAERTTDAPYDICVWGEPGRAAEYEAAGATWFVMSFLAEEPLAAVRAAIDAGPQGSQ